MQGRALIITQTRIWSTNERTESSSYCSFGNFSFSRYLQSQLPPLAVSVPFSPCLWIFESEILLGSVFAFTREEEGTVFLNFEGGIEEKNEREDPMGITIIGDAIGSSRDDGDKWGRWTDTSSSILTGPSRLLLLERGQRLRIDSAVTVMKPGIEEQIKYRAVFTPIKTIDSWIDALMLESRESCFLFIHGNACDLERNKEINLARINRKNNYFS